VIEAGQFILGPQVEAFERQFAVRCGVKHAIGVANGTDALVLALRALGIGPGDEVISAPNSFVASASCIGLVRAKPVFADVGPDYLIDPACVEAAITRRTKAIIPVHLTGRPCNMDALCQIAKQHRLHIIEDAAQSVSATFRGQAVGSFGTFGCFSLHPLKTLNACGDGGVITTHDDALAEKIRLLRNLGLKTRAECVEWAPNSRLDTMQAAMLLVKLQVLDKYTERRRENAQLYRERLAGIDGIECPVDAKAEYAVYHTFVVQADRRDALREHLKAQGVETTIHYPIPIHLQPVGRSLNYPAGSFPNAEKQAGRILSLPVYPELTVAEIDYVCDAIRKFYVAAPSPQSSVSTLSGPHQKQGSAHGSRTLRSQG
jgi:dTDP-4-amino-4,6-dideoxygalactose transaminase